MTLPVVVELIMSVGFPIVCVIVMGWFIYQIYKKTTEQNEANMAQVQARCQQREDKLYEELAKSREINEKAIETIAHYAEKLDVIQHDVNEIKTDITILAARSE